LPEEGPESLTISGAQPIEEADAEDVALVRLPWGDFGPFDDLADTARSEYAGNNRPAVLNATASGVFVDTLLFGPFAQSRLLWDNYRSARLSPLDLLQNRMYAELHATSGEVRPSPVQWTRRETRRYQGTRRRYAAPAFFALRRG